MTDKYSKLTNGTVISNESFIIDEPKVIEYLNSINDSSNNKLNSSSKNHIPPMCISALSLRGVISKLEIPGGTIHTSQELEFINIATIGEKLSCKANLVLNSTRGDWRFLTISMKVTNENGNTIMLGKSNIMLPINNK